MHNGIFLPDKKKSKINQTQLDDQIISEGAFTSQIREQMLVADLYVFTLKFGFQKQPIKKGLQREKKNSPPK